MQGRMENGKENDDKGAGIYSRAPVSERRRMAWEVHMYARRTKRLSEGVRAAETGAILDSHPSRREL